MVVLLPCNTRQGTGREVGRNGTGWQLSLSWGLRCAGVGVAQVVAEIQLTIQGLDKPGRAADIARGEAIRKGMAGVLEQLGSNLKETGCGALGIDDLKVGGAAARGALRKDVLVKLQEGRGGAEQEGGTRKESFCK